MDAPSNYNYWDEPDPEDADLVAAFIIYLLSIGGF